MTSPYLTGHGTRETPQDEQIRDDQIENEAGGFVWSIGPWERLRRFLILGSEGGSYYATERDMTKQNVDALRECLSLDGIEAVAMITAISMSGRAPKNELAIFALAYAAGNGDELTRKFALEAMPKVCRTGTHLFQFLEYVQQHRGWGPALKKAVANWYLEKQPSDLAYQLVKYRQRGGWTHADVLRLAKPRPKRGSEHDQLFAWTVGKFNTTTDPDADVPPVVRGFERAQAPGIDVARTLLEFPKLPREALPSDSLTSPNVWEALLDNGMPMTALIRNLANMTRIGLLTPTSSATRTVLAQLADGERIRKARVHPISVLMALMTYASGRSVRGSNEWSPLPSIVDALDEAFYAAFANVEPTGKRYLLALDISGSMDSGYVAGVRGLTPRMASSAMAMVTARTEAIYECVGFYAAGPHAWDSPPGQGAYYSGYSSGLTPIPLSKKQRLDDVVRFTNGLPFGGTDCSLPMLYAIDNSREVDVFVVLTDSETWAGTIHPAQALEKYRQVSGIPAKLIVVGMTANDFTIADPNDAGQLDVVGFDASAPAVMAEFALGNV